ncbi:MAG TPA: radical SAM family heme chaperone HemW [Candidatus Limnocylindrales bacterium]
MSMPLPPVSLYVHLPFCVARCPYCDFVVYAGGDACGPRARTERLYEAVGRELELRADAVAAAQALAASSAPPAARPPLRTVYFGGGTPSLVPGEWLERLMAIIRSRFGIAPDAEVTIEANPGHEDMGDLAAFRRAGVTRISFGAQSLDAGELRRLGRRHSPADVAAAVAAAREAGIGSINLDLLYDVPGQTVEDWERTLRAAMALAPDHLSLYALTLDDPDEEGITGAGGDHLPTAPGARRWREKARLQQDDDRAADQYILATDLLAAEGWRGYEISNWTRPGHESRHNLVYWQREPYEAVGPGAHAFDGVTRRWNSAAMEPYVAALMGERSGLAAPSLPPGGAEVLSDDVARAESVILALRLDRGVDAGAAARAPLAEVRDWALAAGLLEAVNLDGEARVRLTTRGRLLSNELFSRLV